MKKYWKTKQYKRSIKYSQLRSIKRRIKTSQKKRKERTEEQGLSHEVLKQRKMRKKIMQKFFTVYIPENFSFVNNTEGLLKFFEKLAIHFQEHFRILLDFRKVQTFTNDSIVILLSKVKDKEFSKGKEVRVRLPKDPEMKKTIEESGIINNVYLDPNSHRNSILTRKNKRAEGSVADEIIKRATKTIFGKEGRCPGIYRALMESMANTCYHAVPDQKAVETWWLTIYHDKERNTICFAFVDRGVGIFESSKTQSLLKNWGTKLGLVNNKKTLEKILSGEVRSSTGLYYRGKGLPAIYKGLERNYYSNLKIISNNVKAELDINKYNDIYTNFSGTFLYWELNNTNRWIPYN